MFAKWVGSIACGFVVFTGCGNTKEELGRPPSAPGSTMIEPTRAIHLRAAFDDDPSAYVGRFVPDKSKLEDIDENASAQTRCSEFFAPKVVNTNQQMDEIVFTSSKAAASVGVPTMGSAAGKHTVEGRMRIKYTLSKRIQMVIKDPAGLDRCCKAQPDQCTSKVIGEFLMGTGEVFQFHEKDDDVSANGVVKAVTGNVEYKDNVAWKRVNSFTNMYFAFLTTAVSTVGSGAGDATAADASCSWCETIPGSLDGKFFCGVSPDVATEAMARDLAMRNGREQVVKFLGEYISTQSSTQTSALKDLLDDTQVITAAASGLASQVKDQKWCKPERTDSPNGRLYKSRVLAFFPNADKAAAARATLETALTTRKAAGKVAPDEEKQVRKLIDNLK